MNTKRKSAVRSCYPAYWYCWALLLVIIDGPVMSYVNMGLPQAD